MRQKPESASNAIKKSLRQAALALGAQDPVPYVGDILDRSFALPQGDPQYAYNNLEPGAVPFEPSFSERDPYTLRFTVEPSGPGTYPLVRRNDATAKMRQLVGSCFGPEALHWFDRSSEEWRGFFSHPRLYYGAWFGTAYDKDGLQSSKIYYELSPGQLTALSPELAGLAMAALHAMPQLVPIFTTITCRREHGRQRVTFLHVPPLRLADLSPLLERLGLGHQLPGIMQIVGLTLGGRFDLPARSAMIGLSGSLQDPELKLEVLLGLIDDLPAQFPQLLTLGLAERPQQLRALQAWYEAFTPEELGWPGNLSVLSVRVNRTMPARVGVYLRPVEFEINPELSRAVPQA